MQCLLAKSHKDLATFDIFSNERFITFQQKFGNRIAYDSVESAETSCIASLPAVNQRRQQFDACGKLIF